VTLSSNTTGGRRAVGSIAACLVASAVLLAAVPISASEQRVSAADRSQGPGSKSLRTSVPGDLAPGEVLVTFEQQVARASRASAVARSVAGAAIDSTVSPGVVVVEIPPGTSVPAAAARLRSDDAVAWAEPNWYRRALYVPNDPWLQSSLTKAHALDAWDVEAGDPATVIAVVDTGADASHPDLDGNLWTNPGETPGNDEDDDGNGFTDDIYGWDFLSGDATPQDAHGHGTHVAGIAAAEWDNGLGGSGACPECSLMILRAGNGTFRSSDVIAAVRYAADNGADVINLSLGGPQWTKAERNALSYAIGKGSLVVAASGNDDRNNDTLWYRPSFVFGPSYPASYDLPGLISVAASKPDDTYAGFSNVGRDSVDLAAPGTNIFSTLPGGFGAESGTSMASPFVAGVAGLLRSANPAWTPVQTQNAILNGVDEGMPAGRSLTNGRVNALASLTSSTADATPRHDGVMSGAVSISYRKQGALSVPKDMNDIYEKRLRKGKVYAALLDVPARRDFDLFVWKPGAQDTFPTDYGCGGLSCFLRAAGVEGKGRDEYVRFKAPKTGVYYFHVNGYKGKGGYTLFVGVPA
jgi:subtilisin family serine protease